MSYIILCSDFVSLARPGQQEWHRSGLHETIAILSPEIEHQIHFGQLGLCSAIDGGTRAAVELRRVLNSRHDRLDHGELFKRILVGAHENVARGCASQSELILNR